MSYLTNIIEKMKQAGVSLTGCTKYEIEDIEKELGYKLPKSYIEFLENLGKATLADESKEDWYFNYPGFQGTTVFYPSVKYLNENLKEQLIEDNNELELPETAFVFYNHQGYLNAFFKLDEGDNPPVYGYEDGYEGDTFPKIADSLSSFYERHLEGDKTLFSELRV